VESRQIAPSSRSGLQTALDVIVAPKAAFLALREVPTWGWAFLVAAVLAVVGSIVTGPAIGHAMATEMPAKLAASPQFAQMPADQRDAAIARTVGFFVTFAKFSFIIVIVGILVSGLIQALIMLIANAIGKGDGNFKKFWALSINVSVVGSGVASIVLMIIVLIRGADSFNSTVDIAGSVPSLALVAPGAGKTLATFLGTINIFNIWTAVLLAMGMGTVARIPRGVAVTFAVLMLVAAAGFAASGQR